MTQPIRQLAAALLFALAAAFAAPAQAGQEGAGLIGFKVPFADAQEGRRLFVGKGCVVCHAINGVGGKAAPPLDGDPSQRHMDVFDFAARMWRGAATMIVLQEMELGYQITMTGPELAHLTRFVTDVEEQKKFSEADIPEVIRDWMVDEVYEELDLDSMAQ